ncbi:MAG TPA: hypothetical protein VKE96_16425 [Vicinamibacterales bacterium]|nr:hypothetical protein [Vicinamibacterales bacterium]
MTARSTLRLLVCCIAVLIWIPCVSALDAQQTPVALTPVPRMMWFGGSFHPADGQPVAPIETMTLAVYPDQQGGTPLWLETQTVVMASDGRYNVLLGSTTADGLPLELFTAGEPRWLGVRFHRAGESEQPRVQLASVPYALKAADADTLGGRPASAYLLAAEPAASAAAAPASVKAMTASGGGAVTQVTAGTVGRIAKFATGTDLGDSALFQAGASAGVTGPGIAATFAPLDAFHVAFSDAGGAITGYAVQNTSSSPTAYSGMLFYDQNGALGQFQGFNNTTHEYRINNIAAGGSINFMLGSSSKFLVAPSGNVGIGAVPALTDRLRVAGNATVDGNATVNGNLVTTGNIAAKYQDVAEWVETSSPLDAGTVVIVDPKEPNRVLPAPKAYDTRVAGAVSAQPGLVLGERGDGKAMVAQSGRVRVKADASYGAIKIGDLLVTSPKPGYAMRSKPMRVGARTMHRPGTLLGKALEALPSGQGEILVLLTLQ